MPDTPTDQTCRCHLCEPGAGLFDHTPAVADHVRELGWHTQGVLGEGEILGWAYSIGLWHSYRSPEVAILGFPAAEANKIINTLGGMARDGEPLRAGQRLAGVFSGYDVVLRDVHRNWYLDLFGQAIGFYQAPPLPFLQVCWPDREGRFVWDDEVGERFRANQPQLWVRPDEHPPGPWKALAGPAS